MCLTKTEKYQSHEILSMIHNFVNKLTSLSQLKINVIANYIGKFWTSLLGFLLVPVYLYYLGVEAYGLLGAFSAIVSFINLLDLGLNVTIGREVARRWAIIEQRVTIPDLLRTAEIIYWGVGAFLMVLMILLSQPVTIYWLQAEKLDTQTVRLAILIFGLKIAIRWPATPYTGTLTALEKHVQLNVVQGVLKTLQGVGSVVVLVWVSRTIIGFLLWQMTLAIIEVITLMILAWRAVPPNQFKPCFKINILHQIWPFAARMSATTVVTLVLVNIDKILLSKLLSLEQFGYYALANTLSTQILQIIYPLLYALSPRLNAIVAQSNEEKLAKIYHKSCLVVSCLVTPFSAALVMWAPLILELWTRSPHIAEESAAALSILAFGTLMNSMMNIPYSLQLAIGKPQIAAMVNTCALIILLPALFVVVPLFGTVGAALIWASLNTFYYLITSRITHYYILSKSYKRWLIYDTFIPILLSFTTFSIGRMIITAVREESYTLSLISLLASILCSYTFVFLWYLYQQKLSKLAV